MQNYQQQRVTTTTNPPPPRPTRPARTLSLAETHALSAELVHQEPRLLPRPLPPGGLRNRVLDAITSGYWYCRDCECMCDREEGEQGQPAHCSRCMSPRIEWNSPVQAL